MDPSTQPIRPHLSDEQAAEEARRLIADFATSYRDDSPLPAVGDAPPVPQPGRTAMSQGATDASVMMLAGGASAAMVGGTTAVVMYLSQYANPVICGIVFGAPTALVLALSRLATRARDVLPDEHHHHYNGEVHQQHVHNHTTNRWWGKSTTNQ